MTINPKVTNTNSRFSSSRQEPGFILTLPIPKMDPGLTGHSAAESRRGDGISGDFWVSRQPACHYENSHLIHEQVARTFPGQQWERPAESAAHEGPAVKRAWLAFPAGAWSRARSLPMLKNQHCRRDGSKTRAGALQEFDFVGCGFTPENLVSMRIASEPIDDRLVSEFEIQVAAWREFPKQLFRPDVDCA